MQVEHKTEKGIILFIKVHDDAKWFMISPMTFIYHKFINKTAYPKSIRIPDGKWQLMGLTSDITEEIAIGIVDDESKDTKKMYKSYMSDEYLSHSAKGSFKSLIQHLQVYEVNPFDNYECDNHWRENGYIDMGYNEKLRCQFCQENEDKQDEAEERTGKYIVLFKEN